MRIHICNYHVDPQSKDYRNGIRKWQERCRCGRLVLIEQSWDVSNDSILPKIKKVWYAYDGQYEKTTGNGSNDLSNTKPVDTQ